MKLNQQPQTNFRIDTIFRSLAYLESVAGGRTIMTPRGPQMISPRELTASEQGLRNSAVEVLRNYITGEIEFINRNNDPMTQTPEQPHQVKTRQYKSNAPPSADPDITDAELDEALLAELMEEEEAAEEQDHDGDQDEDQDFDNTNN